MMLEPEVYISCDIESASDGLSIYREKTYALYIVQEK